MSGDGPTISRRRFLTRTGVLGAGLVVLGPASDALARSLTAGQLDAAGDQALHQLAQDTFRGMVVMWVPGRDAYSRAQGEMSATPGAVEAKVDQFLLDDLDLYLPFPNEILSPVAAALVTAAHDNDPKAPVLPLPGALASGLDAALGRALGNNPNQGTPITLVVALFLNYLATSVRPTAVAGPFPASPFANLGFSEKLEAWRRLEQDHPQLLGLVDAKLSEPARESLSGLLKLLGSALPTFTAFAAFSEYEAFDRTLRRATHRPIGWHISNFARGRSTPANGWNEFKGYHKGVR